MEYLLATSIVGLGYIYSNNENQIEYNPPPKTYEFYQICEANIQVQKHKDDIELATNQYSRTFTKEDSDRRIGRMNDFLNEIQEFISEVKMIASENEDTRI